MPKITSISVQTKNKDRCNLFVDGNFFAGISLITLVKSRLKVDDEVDEKELKNLLLESERTQAFTKAVDYLSRAMKTKRQVKEYLLNKGYDEQIVWYCIDKLKDYGYIDDSEYSKRYISSCSKNQGKRLVEYKLMAKGVKKEDIENAYSDVDVDSKSNAKAVAEKYLKNKETTKENMAKAYRYLIGRGFSYEDATFALSFFNGED
jgi:regulatory protein